jgi:hypothetical protein
LRSPLADPFRDLVGRADPRVSEDGAGDGLMYRKIRNATNSGDFDGISAPG